MSVLWFVAWRSTVTVAVLRITPAFVTVPCVASLSAHVSLWLVVDAATERTSRIKPFGRSYLFGWTVAVGAGVSTEELDRLLCDETNGETVAWGRCRAHWQVQVLLMVLVEAGNVVARRAGVVIRCAA